MVLSGYMECDGMVWYGMVLRLPNYLTRSNFDMLNSGRDLFYYQVLSLDPTVLYSMSSHFVPLR